MQAFQEMQRISHPYLNTQFGVYLFLGLLITGFVNASIRPPDFDNPPPPIDPTVGQHWNDTSKSISGRYKLMHDLYLAALLNENLHL